MLQMWLENLKKLPRMPAVIERYAVAKARDEINQATYIAAKSQARTLWVDISVISRRDAGSGIQRVVRALLAELQALSITGWHVQPVAATPRQPYRAVPWQIPAVSPKQCPKIEPQAGDIFLGLDLSAHIIPRRQREMAVWKSRGLKLAFVIYDLLPLHHPQWFSAKLVRSFRRWIKSVASLADQVFCISLPVKQDFEACMHARYGLQPGTIATHVFPMGGDIKASQPSTGFPEQFFDRLGLIQQGKSALMVGTIEPRKGYDQILDAFEHLWVKGCAHKLVIVGRTGWMTETLQNRITSNPMLDRQLFWFDNASDEALNMLYELCSGVILASHAEGFGLPLLEALEHGKPVLARDLAVFHQIESPLVNYFAAKSDTEAIGTAIDQWLELSGKPGKLDQNNSHNGFPTWRDSLNGLLKRLLPPEAILDSRCSEFA